MVQHSCYKVGYLVCSQQNKVGLFFFVLYSYRGKLTVVGCQYATDGALGVAFLIVIKALDQ